MALGERMRGLLYDPLFNASIGLLAAGGPSRFPVGLGQAVGQGLLGAQRADAMRQDMLTQQQRAELQKQQLQMQLEQRRQAAEQQAKQQQALEQLNLDPRFRGLLAAGVSPDKVFQAAGLLPVGGLDPTSGMQEYQLAVQQGYKGSFFDWKRDLAQAGRSAVNVFQGGAGARPMTPEDASMWGIPPEDASKFYISDKGEPKQRPQSTTEVETERTEAKKAIGLGDFDKFFNAYQTAAESYQDSPFANQAIDPTGRADKANTAREALVAWVAKNILGSPGAEPGAEQYRKARELVPDYAGPIDSRNFMTNMQLLRQLVGRAETESAAPPPPPGFVEVQP